MNIIRENIDDLNAVLKVSIAKDDYLTNVEEAIKKYRKTVTMKGFRKGHVPASLVRNMYGNSVLFEEVNKLVTSQINEYLEKEKLEILGQPLPKAADIQIDIKNPQDYDFEYELGLTPAFEVGALTKKTKIEKHVIKVDDQLLTEEVDNVRLRYGNMTHPEGETEENDVLTFEIQELENGAIKEGGLQNNTPIGLSLVKDEKIKKELLKIKTGESIDLKVFDVFDRDRDAVLKHILGIKEDAPENLGDTFRFTLEKISRMEKAELNQEFFDKIYGPGQIDSEEAFKEKIATEISNYFGQDSENKLKKNIMDTVLEKTEIALPDTFLKKWIKSNNEKPISDEEVEKDYDNFSRGLKWQLIVNKLGKEHDIKVEREEIAEASKDQLRKQLQMYSPNGEPIKDEDLETFNASMMAREDHVKKTFEQLMEQKLFSFLKEKVTIEEKEVTMEEFRNLN